MQISNTLSTTVGSLGASKKNEPVETTAPATDNKVNGNDKDKEKVRTTAPAPAPQLTGGMTMAAVWASQEEGREADRAAAEAEKAKAKAFKPPAPAPDAQEAALKVLENTAQVAEARRAEQAKAAEERRAEESSKKEDPFAEKEDPFASRQKTADPFAPEPETTTQLSRPSPGLQSYQAAFAPRANDTGATVDGTF